MREKDFMLSKKGRVKYTTNLDPDIRDEVKKIAIDRKETPADIINRLLKGFVDGERKKPTN